MALLTNAMRVLCALTSTVALAAAPQRAASPGNERLRIVVELNTAAPSCVAIREARSAGRILERATPEARVLRAQDEFLRELQVRGIDFAVTDTPVRLGSEVFWRPNRFAFLINAIGLSVPA